ncbi:hypothetical protein K4K54_011947 [Colletotrichum sp. SAR 10_86]|nr:hypothetical protein K4K54_011947 [Colletotrichum sp. SAR 10_86]
MRARRLRHFHAHLETARPARPDLLDRFTNVVLGQIDALLDDADWRHVPIGSEEAVFQPNWEKTVRSLTRQLAYAKKLCTEKKAEEGAGEETRRQEESSTRPEGLHADHNTRPPLTPDVRPTGASDKAREAVTETPRPAAPNTASVESRCSRWPATPDGRKPLTRFTQLYMQYLEAEENVSQRERKMKRTFAAAENAIKEVDVAKAGYNADAVARFTSAYEVWEKADTEFAEAAKAEKAAARAFEA